jgi:L-alanine-DL-glutamate epimerase-like enolase superfamily enzyme
MKIDRITVWHLDLPLAKPYWLSGGRLKFERLDSTIVRLDTDEGVHGWGEGCPWGSTYLPAFGRGIRAGLEELAPVVLGSDPRCLDVLNRRMDVALPGHPYVKSAIDIACWDILGKIAGLPLCDLLGGREEGYLLTNSSIPTGTPEAMVASIAEARARGYRVHSCKVGGADSAGDRARIEAVMRALPEGEHVTFDVNRAWTPGIAIEVMNAVAGFAPGWFEQPCETLDQCEHVRRNTRQPIMLDECLHTMGDHVAAHGARACEGVKVKPNRLGGLTRARQVRDFGVSVGWQMHVEDVGGTVLADTAAIHLAQSTPQANRLASWIGHDHLVDDIAPGQGARNMSGRTTAPDLPGLGVEPELDRLGEPTACYV